MLSALLALASAPPPQAACAAGVGPDPMDAVCVAASAYWQGRSHNDHIGFSLDAGRDWDGDGAFDVVWGGVNADVLPSVGEVVELDLAGPFPTGVTSCDPPAAGEVLAPNQQVFDPARGLRIETPDQADKLGHSVAFLGDLDGDGREDLGLGAPLRSAGPGAEAGTVYVLLGRDLARLPPLAPGTSFHDAEALVTDGGITDTILRGDAAGDRFGWSLERLGDVNNDGFDDFAVGAPGGLANLTGKVYVFLGGAAWITGEQPAAGVAWAALDGDTPGLAALVEEGDEFGMTIAALGGDANGDGYGDFAVGAPETGDHGGPVGHGYFVLLGGNDGAAQPKILSPRMEPPASLGAAPGDQFARSMDGMGADADGDGVPDLLVGAPAWDLGPGQADAGRVYVLSSRRIATAPQGALLSTLEGDSPGAWFGLVRGNPFQGTCGNACAPFAVGSFRYTHSGADLPCQYAEAPYPLVGKVSVFSRKGTPLRSWLGENARDRLGAGIAWTPNVAGTPFCDLLLAGFAWNHETTPDPCHCTLSTAQGGTACSEPGRIYLMLL